MFRDGWLIAVFGLLLIGAAIAVQAVSVGAVGALAVVVGALYRQPGRRS